MIYLCANFKRAIKLHRLWGRTNPINNINAAYSTSVQVLSNIEIKFEQINVIPKLENYLFFQNRVMLQPSLNLVYIAKHPTHIITIFKSTLYNASHIFKCHYYKVNNI